MFRFSIEGVKFEWNGGHTINVEFIGGSKTVFSIDYGRDDWTCAEVMAQSLYWLEDQVMAGALARLEEEFGH